MKANLAKKLKQIKTHRFKLIFWTTIVHRAQFYHQI
jgi:hypothetical protein